MEPVPCTSASLAKLKTEVIEVSSDGDECVTPQPESGHIESSGDSDVIEQDSDDDTEEFLSAVDHAYRRIKRKDCKHKETVNVLIAQQNAKLASEQDETKSYTIYDALSRRDGHVTVYVICADCSKYSRTKRVGRRVLNKYSQNNVQKIVLTKGDIDAFSCDNEKLLTLWCYTAKGDNDVNGRITISQNALTLVSRNREKIRTENHYVTLTDGRRQVKWIGRPLFEAVLRREYVAYRQVFDDMSQEERRSCEKPLPIGEYMGYWLANKTLAQPNKKPIDGLVRSSPACEQLENYYSEYLAIYDKLRIELKDNKEKVLERLEKMTQSEFNKKLLKNNRIPVISYKPYSTGIANKKEQQKEKSKKKRKYTSVD